MSEFEPNILNEIEREERRVASFSTPGPTREAVERAKAAMRQELRSRSFAARRRWPAAVGTLAAAAMIVLAVYVGWASKSGGETGAIAQTPQDVSQLSATPEQTVMVTFDKQQKELEEWSEGSNWDYSGSNLSAALDEVWSEPARGHSEKGKRSS